MVPQMMMFFVGLAILLVSSQGSSLVLRIRRGDGTMGRLPLPPQSTFGDLYDALKNTGFLSSSSIEQIRFRESKELCATLINNNTKLLDTYIRNGDVLTIESVEPASAGSKLQTQSSRKRLAAHILHKEAIKSTNRQRMRTLTDIERERSTLVKISRQVPNDKFSAAISSGVVGWLKDWKRKAAGVSPNRYCILLFGKYHSDRSEQLEQQAEILTAVEIPVNEVTGDLDDSSMFMLEKATLVGNTMGLRVLGCCFDVGTSMTGMGHVPSPADVRSSLRVRSVSPLSHGSPFLILTCKKTNSEEDVELEAFYLSEQAITLHKNDLLSTTTSIKDAPEHPSLLTLRGPVLLPNAVESLQVDSQLLLVPASIRHVDGQSREFAHAFPSLVQIQNEDSTQRRAREYLCVTLRRIVQEPLESSRRKDALQRLWDGNLLLYLSLSMDIAVFDELCRHLSQLHTPAPHHRGASPLPAEVVLSLETLLQSLDD